MKSTFSILALAALGSAQKGNFPAKGDGDFAGGIFGISLTDLSGVMMKSGMDKFFGTGSESPKGAKQGTIQSTPGSGPYPAKWFTDPSLPRHVIYAPKTPPPVKMPVVAWGNGACGMDGTGFANFLLEIASHGYLVIADGPPGGGSGGSAKGGSAKGGSGGVLGALSGGNGGGGQSKVQDMRDSFEWAIKGNAAKLGDIDTSKIAAAGQSCGGHEAYSVSYHDPRVKLTMLFNMGIYQDNKRYLLQELKAPVAYFLGGPKDTGYPNGEKDYPLLPKGLPAFKAVLDTGHLGTYWATNGGKSGKAAVAYLEWQFRGDAKSKAICLDPASPGSLVSDHWNVTYKNWT